MNIQELKCEMVRNSITIPKLANALGVSKKTLYSRIEETTSFTQREIAIIAKELELSTERMMLIFFTELVS